MSHTKPWRDSTNEERLNGENGLLLTPTIDHLFDKGFISFEDKGDLIVSPVADRASLLKMAIGSPPGICSCTVDLALIDRTPPVLPSPHGQERHRSTGRSHQIKSLHVQGHNL